MTWLGMSIARHLPDRTEQPREADILGADIVLGPGRASARGFVRLLTVVFDRPVEDFGDTGGEAVVVS